MTIAEHAEEFAGFHVRDYDPNEGVIDPALTAQRLSVGYDDENTFGALLGLFLNDPATPRVTALVIGSWTVDDPSESSEEVITTLSSSRDRLPAVKALFLGDITADENEISWIQQSDITPLLAAFPALEHLRVRGGSGLRLGPVRHEALKSLVVESGGLPGEFVRAVGAADFPNLEHLELWLGSDDYGGSTTPEDLAPILSGGRLPGLKSLALRNSEHADRVAAALADAPVLRRIETLDLSLGTLGDEGVVALLSGGNLAGLKTLDIHHHYVSDEVLDGLKALGIGLDADDRQVPDDLGDGEEFRYISSSE